MLAPRHLIEHLCAGRKFTPAASANKNKIAMYKARTFINLTNELPPVSLYIGAV